MRYLKKQLFRFLEKLSVVSATDLYEYYQIALQKEIDKVKTKAELTNEEKVFYKDVHKTIESPEHNLSNLSRVHSDNSVISAIAKNTYRQKITGIYWLDGWFQSTRFDMDRFTSNEISINTHCANKIWEKYSPRKGEYILVIEDLTRELKKEITSTGFDGVRRIIRDGIHCQKYYTRLIWVTDDGSEEYTKDTERQEQRITEVAEKIAQKSNVIVQLDKPSTLKQFNEIREKVSKKIKEHSIIQERFYDIKGKIIERKVIYNIADISFMNFKEFKPLDCNIGDVAYIPFDNMAMMKTVTVIEKLQNGYLVKDNYGNTGEVKYLYDSTTAYLKQYFKEHKTTACLKWGQDHKILKQ